MQMLESFLGPQGARYAQFILAALVLLILILVVWWLIRKAMGDRLNMSDKPDRRGRPPRLGITESFAVDRQGRRLVMVRRDNVEHLVMIGGPNDVLIESNVVRGERSAVARPEVRLSEADLMPQVAAPVATAEPPPPAPAPLPPKPAPALKPVEVKPVEVMAPVPVPVPVPAPVPVAPAPVVAQPVAPAPKPVSPPPFPAPVVELPKVELPRPVVADAPALKVEPAVAGLDGSLKSTGQSLAERIRSGVSATPATAKISEPIKPPEPVKVPEPPRETPPPVADVPEKPVAKAGLFDSMKAKMGEALKAPAAAPTEPVMPKPAVDIVAPPPPPPPPVAAQAPPPAPVAPPPPAPPVSAAPPPSAASAPPAPAPARPASRNPFDSLEEEMAKLLGRAPDGKG